MEQQHDHLFRRIPEEIFKPLSGRNRLLYWRVLHTLYDAFFAGDLVLPGIGVPKAEIVETIGHCLEEHALALEHDEGADASQPPALQVYHRLVDTGWLCVEQDNFRAFISLSPYVAQLLGALVEVATSRPAYFGGKVQLIYNTVTRSREEPTRQALAFHEACRNAVDFARHLNNIVVRIRDLHAQITTSNSPQRVLATFFDDFVANLLIADYKDLKTTNHPFRFRRDILLNAHEIQSDAGLRAQYIEGYRSQMHMPADEAERAFERDLSTLITVFSSVEQHLERLDTIKYRLEARVHNMIRFASKSTDTLSRDIRRTVAVLIAGTQAPEAAIDVPLTLGEGLSANRLYQPPAAKAPPAPRKLQRRAPDPRLRALAQLAREARRARHVTAQQLLAYVERHMHAQLTLSSDELTIRSVPDYCAFITLARVPVAPAAFRRRFHRFFSVYAVTPVAGELTDNPYVTAPKVVITRIAQTRKTSGALDHA